MELPELNLKVLLKLSLPEILSFCRTSKEYQKLCEDEHFWKQKLELEYPGSSQFKRPGVTYREMYFGFYDAHLPAPMIAPVIPGRDRKRSIAIQKDYLSVLEWLSLTNPPSKTDANDAVREKSLRILEWLLANGIAPDQWAISMSMFDCRVDVLNLLEKYGILPGQRAIDSAARVNCDTVMEWLYKRGFQPDQRTLLEAVKGSAGKAIVWLWDHGVRPDPDNAEELTYAAADSGYLEILKWLYSLGIRPTESDLYTAAHSDHLKILKWMSQLNPPLLPDSELVDSLVQFGGSIEMLEWMRHLNPPVLPTQEGINLAAANGYLDVLEWASRLPSPILPSRLDDPDDDIKEWVRSVRKRLMDQIEQLDRLNV